MPGLDSQQASELMAAAGAGDAGLTAQVVVTPLDERRDVLRLGGGPVRARAAPGRRRRAAPRARRPPIRRRAGRRSRGGGAAVSCRGRARRADPAAVPARGRALSRGPQQPQGLRCRGSGRVAAADRDGWRPLLRVRAVAARRWASSSACSSRRSSSSSPSGPLIATALPLGTAVLGLAIGVSSMSLLANVIDIPSWAPVLGAMVGLGSASTTPCSS